MKTLLRIDASIRLADSYTRALTGYFEETWLQANPESRVIHRCLISEPVPHLSQETFEAFQSPGTRTDACTLSDALISEIKLADHILIGSPLYNMSLPSALKAYFDHIVRYGITFGTEQGNYIGLLNDKRATLITARGGHNSPDYISDFQTDYLKQILAFIGISCVESVMLEGTAADQFNKDASLSRTKREIDQLCNPAPSPA